MSATGENEKCFCKILEAAEDAERTDDDDGDDDGCDGDGDDGGDEYCPTSMPAEGLRVSE